MAARVLRQRKRKLCLKCGENLSHTAYVCHQNPLICPGKLDTLSERKRNVNELAHSVLTDSDEIQPTPTSGGSTHMAHGDEIDSIDIRPAYDANMYC